MATVMNPRRLIPQSSPRFVYTANSCQTTSQTRHPGQLTSVSNQGENSSKNTPQKQICGQRAGSQPEIRVHEVANGALKDAEETETEDGCSNAETYPVDTDV